MAENDLPAAFLSALPQIVRLHAPCPCSHAGRIYMQKTGISQDFANAMPRPCSGHEKGFANWVDFLQHARPLKDPAHQCIRRYIQEQQISGPSTRNQLISRDEEEDATRRSRRATGSRGSAREQPQVEGKEEDHDRRLLRPETSSDLRRESTFLERITTEPIIVEVTGLKIKQANKSRLTQAITDVLPEASKWMTGLYPKTNKKGDFLGSVAIEFEKREEGRLMGYLTSLSFQSAYLDVGDREAISAYPDLAAKLRARKKHSRVI